MLKLVQNHLKVRGENIIRLAGDVFWDLSCSSGDCSSHTGDGIRISADGNRQPDGIFKVHSFQVCPDSLRTTALTGNVKTISWTNLVNGEIKIISEFLFHECLDSRLGIFRECVAGLPNNEYA